MKHWYVEKIKIYSRAVILNLEILYTLIKSLTIYLGLLMYDLLNLIGNKKLKALKRSNT